MEAGAGLVAGSHARHELIIIAPDSLGVKSESLLTEQSCGICRELVGLTKEGEPFIACNECGFPVCRSCYDYERKEGNQSCPCCNTRYKRHKGCPRVEGDEDEDDVDDLHNEFDLSDNDKNDKPRGPESVFYYGRGGTRHGQGLPQVPLLTNGSVGDPHDIPPESHALVVPPFMGTGGKRIHPLPYMNSMNMAVHPRPLDPSKDLTAYGYGSVTWKDRLDQWKSKMQVVPKDGSQGGDGGKGNDGDEDDAAPIMDESRQPLSRKVPISSSQINPYRMVIVIRLVVLCFFLRYRILNPVPDAVGIWLTSVICEIWFALSWILDQFPKWLPINRETYLDRLSLRYEKEGEKCGLAAVDFFVSTVDPMKEPPLVTANTILSILAVDYPVDKVSCYVSDDGAAMLTFEAMSETSEFARKWAPFCKKFSIEPRAPEMYFSQKIDYLKDKVHPSFVKERRAMKREYEEFKVRMNALVAKAKKVPEEGWTMQDGTLWPGNNSRDHPGMIQVFLGHSGGVDTEGNELPRLVYVSREKRPGFNHHKKAGAMNALIRVSAVLTNAPYILNLDCDHYVNNSKALREAMCFMMDPILGKRVCYVQFPQRFDGIDRNDRYANNNTVFFDINLRGLDGIQGPVYVGTGCVFRRQALYANNAPKKTKPSAVSGGKGWRCCPSWCCGLKKKARKLKSKFRSDKKKRLKNNDANGPMLPLENIEEGIEGIDNEKGTLMPQKKLEVKFGQSPVFIASTFLDDGGVLGNASPATLLKEAVHVISCGYEDKTDWGKEVGWIYGSVTEDILTGFKMHVRGWRSIYCMPKRAAFKGSAPINLTDRLHQVLRWALGSVEILLSRHCPIWYGYGGGLKWLERLAYINTIVYPLTSIPLLAYCSLPAICLLTNRFIMPTISALGSLWFLALFISIFVTGILEIRWSRVAIDEWWRNEQFWVIGGVSAHLFALFQGLLKVLAGVDTSFTVTSKATDEADQLAELYTLKWSSLLIIPTSLLIINIVGVVAGISDAINNGYTTWGPLFGKLFFAIWVILHLYPFLKGLMGRQNRTPTIVIVWSILLASIFSLLWVRINPFIARSSGPSLEPCGLLCD